VSHAEFIELERRIEAQSAKIDALHGLILKLLPALSADVAQTRADAQNAIETVVAACRAQHGGGCAR
jgi:hypothetical protein